MNIGLYQRNTTNTTNSMLLLLTDILGVILLDAVSHYKIIKIASMVHMLQPDLYLKISENIDIISEVKIRTALLLNSVGQRLFSRFNTLASSLKSEQEQVLLSFHSL